MTQTTDHLPIERLFAERLQCETGETARDVTVVRRWARSYSDVFLIQYRLKTSQQFIVAKRIVDHDSNRFLKYRGHESKVEYDTLKFIKDKLHAVPHVKVPNPRLIDHDSNCYFMDFVDGEELESLMTYLRFYAPRSSLLQLSQVFFYAGQWLRHFQKITGIEYKNAGALDSIVDHCEHRLKLIEEIPDSRCPKQLRDPVMRQIDWLMTTVRRPIAVAGCHGDFGPWNMIVSGDELTVIDFFTFRREFMALDATSLLVSLENQNAAPSYSERRIKHLASAFMQGYQPEFEVDAAALELVELLQRVCSIHGALQSPHEYFRERLRSNRILKKNLRWIGDRNRSLIWDRHNNSLR